MNTGRDPEPSWIPGTPILLDAGPWFLRSLREIDVGDDALAWLRDVDVMQHVVTNLSAERFLETLRAADDRSRFLLGLFASGTEKLIGFLKLECNLIHCRAIPTTVIGNKEHWGKGVALDVHARLNEFLFDTLGMHKVEAYVYAENTRAITLLTLRGYTHEGTLRHHECWPSGFRDVHVYGLLEREWRAYRRSASAR